MKFLNEDGLRLNEPSASVVNLLGSTWCERSRAAMLRSGSYGVRVLGVVFV